MTHAITSWNLLLAHTTAGLPCQQCIGVTYRQLHTGTDTAIVDIVDAYHAMAEACDAVVIVSSDYTDLGVGVGVTPTELLVNARIAVNLGAHVLFAVNAEGRSPDDLVDVVRVYLGELAAQRAYAAAMVVNRCYQAQLENVCEALHTFTPHSYVLLDEPLMSAPTVTELTMAVTGTPISGDTPLWDREVTDVLIAGMTAEHVLERLRGGMAVTIPSDHSGVMLAITSAHAAEGFPAFSCIILNDGFELHPSITTLVSGLCLRLPIIATTLGTYETANATASARGRFTATVQRKIDTALALIGRHVDVVDLLTRLAILIPTVITSQMFLYRLQQARSDSKYILFHEGEDDCILKFAGLLF